VEQVSKPHEEPQFEPHSDLRDDEARTGLKITGFRISKIIKASAVQRTKLEA